MSCAPLLRQSMGGFALADMVTSDAALATRRGAHDIFPPLVCGRHESQNDVLDEWRVRRNHLLARNSAAMS